MLRRAIVAALCAFLALSVGVSAPRADGPTWDDLQKPYQYDRQLPLNAEVEPATERGTFTVQKVVFDSTNSQRVPGVLCRPKTPGKVPCILFLHGLGGSKNDAAAAAMGICPMGVAVMGIDAQFHGDRRVEGQQIFSPDLVGSGKAIIQTVVDNRRALDYLAIREDIDSERIALLGASMGSILGSLVASLDERIDGACLLVGGGRWDLLVTGSAHPVVAAIRAQFPEAGPIREAMTFIEPTFFIGHLAPRPLLMVNGRQDNIVPPQSAQALFDAAGEPKEIVWYDGGHLPPVPLVLPKVVSFLRSVLQLPAATPAEPEAAG